MKRLIFCMGKSRRDIIEDLDNKSAELLEHLVKIFIFRDHGNLDHWSKELYGFVPRVSRLKNNKLPKYEDIVYGMMCKHSFPFQRIIDGLVEDYSYEAYSTDAESCKAYVTEYVEWAANELSRYGFLPSRLACANKAVELLQNY